MKKALFKYLIEAGLGEAEVKVYLELLKSPVQTKWEVVKRTGLGRNKVYRSFEKLRELGMVDADNFGGIKAKSLKSLVSSLQSSSRKAGRLAKKIKNLSPYLHMKEEAVQDFEMIYDQDRLLEVYMMMSELEYNTVLDFGDFESFIPMLGGDLSLAFQFRKIRAKHADCKTICTTDGPFSRGMARTSSLKEYRAKMAIHNLDFKDKWIIFSDDDDHVLFSDASGDEHSVLVRSKAVADVQRFQFKQYSQLLEKC